MTKRNRRGIPIVRNPAVGRFGVKLRESRLAAQLTTGALGELIGVSDTSIQGWEQGNIPSPGNLEKLARVFDWDETHPEEPPVKEAPVAATRGLRVALSTPEDELAFSPRKLRTAIEYVFTNVPALIDRYEKSIREIHSLEQRMSFGVTEEQLAILRDKARRFDDLTAIMDRKR